MLFDESFNNKGIAFSILFYNTKLYWSNRSPIHRGTFFPLFCPKIMRSKASQAMNSFNGFGLRFGKIHLISRHNVWFNTEEDFRIYPFDNFVKGIFCSTYVSSLYRAFFNYKFIEFSPAEWRHFQHLTRFVFISLPNKPEKHFINLKATQKYRWFFPNRIQFARFICSLDEFCFLRSESNKYYNLFTFCSRWNGERHSVFIILNFCMIYIDGYQHRMIDAWFENIFFASLWFNSQYYRISS